MPDDPITAVLLLALTGIAVVFAVLLAMIGIVQLLAKFFSEQNGETNLAAASQTSPAGGISAPVSPQLARAIAAAVEYHRNTKS